MKDEVSQLEQDIVEFHEKFALTYDGQPRKLPLDLRDFRVGFLNEEFREYIRASATGTLEQCLDALVDLVYVAIGTSYLHGFPFSEAWDRVHAANMQKVKGDAKSSTRDSDHDVVKPEGWTAPSLSDLVHVLSGYGVVEVIDE